MPEDYFSTGLKICTPITERDVCLHAIDQILFVTKTAYQQVHIVESSSYGKSLLLDRDYQSSTIDEHFYHEFLVHPALLACEKAPQRVLILGGGEGATLREVLRWKSVEQVVMVDIDGEVVEACRQYLPEMHQNAFDDPRTLLKIGDAMAFLEETQETFDAIVSDLSDPIEEGPSFQLFTQEYFQKVRRHLNPGGCFVMQAGSVDFPYLPVHARLFNTVKSLFSDVESYTYFIPSFFSNWGFIMAADRPINTHPDPKAIDKTIAEQITGKLREFDGVSWLGAAQLPRYIREAIARETQIYTLSSPPKHQRF
ncbi:fused MFS/spermidine synthase [Spirulina sp. 06S082]|uniref:fused MFS/spermidine synthase n=1 Tax=Spirulina sp. 06S082 TaxID=3110248 RepID=UPI002B1FFE82|nr:fused MFS/spermidine synthase [Spirulina sp. 06S082]MEA5470549.1 fused MFS/spermidine synthase [Spirulina sp. 06S082]